MKSKQINRILGQMYDLDLDLDLGVSRSESEIFLSQEWDGRLTCNEKDVSHSFVTIILTSVTMVCWADVPDSDWGNFRCRRAVDISILTKESVYRIESVCLKSYSFVLVINHLTVNENIEHICSKDIIQNLCLLRDTKDSGPLFTKKTPSYQYRDSL